MPQGEPYASGGTFTLAQRFSFHALVPRFLPLRVPATARPSLHPRGRGRPRAPGPSRRGDFSDCGHRRAVPRRAEGSCPLQPLPTPPRPGSRAPPRAASPRAPLTPAAGAAVPSPPPPRPDLAAHQPPCPGAPPPSAPRAPSLGLRRQVSYLQPPPPRQPGRPYLQHDASQRLVVSAHVQVHHRVRRAGAGATAGTGRPHAGEPRRRQQVPRRAKQAAGGAERQHAGAGGQSAGRSDTRRRHRHAAGVAAAFYGLRRGATAPAGGGERRAGQNGGGR